jgi:hypothetical protein
MITECDGSYVGPTPPSTHINSYVLHLLLYHAQGYGAVLLLGPMSAPYTYIESRDLMPYFQV